MLRDARRVEKSLRTSVERFDLLQEAKAIAMMRAVARWIIDFIILRLFLSFVMSAKL